MIFQIEDTEKYDKSDLCIDLIINQYFYTKDWHMLDYISPIYGVSYISYI